jgi:hypothetical protein
MPLLSLGVHAFCIKKYFSSLNLLPMNVFPKFGYAAVLRMAILCCGMLFCTAAVKAQATLDIPPFQTATWLGGVEATTVLSAEVTGIEQALLYSQPSNMHQLKIKHTLYERIIGSIQDGMPVNDAAQLNYYRLAPSNHTDVPADPDMSATDWQNLFNDMVNLLTI